MAPGKWQARRLLRLFALIAVLMICVTPFALARLSGQYFVPFPQIVGQNCGRAANFAGGSYDPDEGELCLWRAYTACRAATLVNISQGVDTRSVGAITVQPKARGCAVTDVIQGTNKAFLPGLVPAPIETYQCAGLSQRNGGLLLSDCGSSGFAIYLPPRPPEQVGHVCGAIDTEYSSPYALAGEVAGETASVAGVEDCFWQTYVSCARPSTLVVYDRFFPSGDTVSVDVTHNLVVLASHGSCALTDVVVAYNQRDVKYTCARLTRNVNGGLVAQDCGAEGDIIIPPAAPQPR